MLLAVAGGDDYQQAARSAGRRSGDAVSHLVARFNAEGMAALDAPPRRWPPPTYDLQPPRANPAEAARTPTPEADGTATWSLSVLHRVLRAGPRRAAQGLDLHHLAASSVRPGTPFSGPAPGARPGPPCASRKAGPATVTDPDAGPKKS